jgi:hypothetical protein
MWQRRQGPSVGHDVRPRWTEDGRMLVDLLAEQAEFADRLVLHKADLATGGAGASCWPPSTGTPTSLLPNTAGNPTHRDFEPRRKIVVVSASILGGPLCRRFVFTSTCSGRLLSAT